MLFIKWTQTVCKQLVLIELESFLAFKYNLGLRSVGFENTSLDYIGEIYVLTRLNNTILDCT